jgi:hypothetical protein
MYVNGKMRPIETILGMEEEEIQENGGGGEFKYDMFDTLKDLLQMPQCTPTQHNNEKNILQ